jgi:hypothetical protein
MNPSLSPSRHQLIALSLYISLAANRSFLMMNASKLSPSRRKLRPDLSVRWRGALIISIPVICLFASIFAIAELRSKTLAAIEQEQQSQQTLLEADRLLIALIDAETGVRGYALTRRPEFLNLIPRQSPSTVSLQALRELRCKPIPQSISNSKGFPTLAQQQMSLLEQIKG